MGSSKTVTNMRMSPTCACGEIINVVPALHCPRVGYTLMRHNDIRDTFAKLLNEVCDAVGVEPCHQILQGETFANRSTTTDDDARLDIKANGSFNSRFSRTFFEGKVFYSYAKSCPKRFHICFSNLDSKSVYALF